MSSQEHRIRRGVAAAVTALMVGVVAIGAISPATAQAAGVVVDRQHAYGTLAASERERDEDA